MVDTDTLQYEQKAKQRRKKPFRSRAVKCHLRWAVDRKAPKHFSPEDKAYFYEFQAAWVGNRSSELWEEFTPEARKAADRLNYSCRNSAMEHANRHSGHRELKKVDYQQNQLSEWQALKALLDRAYLLQEVREALDELNTNVDCSEELN